MAALGNESSNCDISGIPNQANVEMSNITTNNYIDIFLDSLERNITICAREHEKYQQLVEFVPNKEELYKYPLLERFLQKLLTFIHKQTVKICNILRNIQDFRRHEKLKVDSATQTDEHLPNNENQFDVHSLAQDVKEAAEDAMRKTNFVYEETSGMYYDYSTGYYYSSELGLYYDGNKGIYYYYDADSKNFQFHSQVQNQTDTSGVSSPNHSDVRELKRKSEDESSVNKNCKLKTDSDSLNGDSSIEEGECESDFDDGEKHLPEKQCQDIASKNSEDDNEIFEAANAWPPCMRLIVQDTNVSGLKIGTLFIVTCAGGTLGREGEHSVLIPDINISKHHAKFVFNESEGKYFISDFGSRNGTYLNDKRLSVSKRESEPHEIEHDNILRIGSTKLLCHIHLGYETCDFCEPGLVQHSDIDQGSSKLLPLTKNEHKKELKRLRKKFGLSSGNDDSSVVMAPGYEDRAQIRRTTVGSQTHHEKTKCSSVHEAIESENKGFKMLTKMGWNKGEALGKSGTGSAEPVLVVQRPDRAGLGIEKAAAPAEDPGAQRKKKVWLKTQERYNALS